MSTATQEVVYANVRQYVREPVNLFLLALIPPLLIVAMSGAISTFSNVIGGNLGERAGKSLSGLWAAAILTGVASFFLAISSARVDGRLVLAGLRPAAVTAAHSGVTLLIAFATTSISLGVLFATQEVSRPSIVFAATLVAALIYGSIGTLLAVYVRGDLEGSFIIILLFMLDAFVGGPLAGGRGVFAEVLPVHFPSQIAVAGMVDATIRTSWAIWSGLYLTVVVILAIVATLRRRLGQ